VRSWLLLHFPCCCTGHGVLQIRPPWLQDHHCPDFYVCGCVTYLICEGNVDTWGQRRSSSCYRCLCKMGANALWSWRLTFWTTLTAVEVIHLQNLGYVKSCSTVSGICYYNSGVHHVDHLKIPVPPTSVNI